MTVFRRLSPMGYVSSYSHAGRYYTLREIPVFEDVLSPLLRGRDPRHIAPLVDLMQRNTFFFGRRGIGMHAISGVEIALWDLLGKSLGAPLCELLGGARRPRLRAYASMHRYKSPEDIASACRHFVREGFGMLKLHQDDLASVQAARETVGNQIELMLDVAPSPWNPTQAIEIARAMSPYRLFWLEEAVWPAEDYRGLARVARAVDTRIAIGEQESTVFGFREIIACEAAQVLQPSVTKVGGVSEFLKIAALAEAANLDVAPHSFYYGPGLAATLHLAATLGGSMPVEFPTGTYATSLLSKPISATNGMVELPAGPGLGVEINDEVIRRHRYLPATTER